MPEILIIVIVLVCALLVAAVALRLTRRQPFREAIQDDLARQAARTEEEARRLAAELLDDLDAHLATVPRHRSPMHPVFHRPEFPGDVWASGPFAERTPSRSRPSSARPSGARRSTSSPVSTAGTFDAYSGGSDSGSSSSGSDGGSCGGGE